MTATKRTLDFTNVTDRNFNIKHLRAGDYPAKVTKVDDAESSAGNAMWVFTIAIHKGAAKGASFPYYCTLDVKTLWKVRALFAAAGLNVPKKKLSADPNKLIGREIGITLDDDEYEGKMKSIIVATIPLREIEAPVDDDTDTATDDDEEEEPPAKKTKKKAKPAVADDEDEEVDDDEELEEIDVDEV